MSVPDQIRVLRSEIESAETKLREVVDPVIAGEAAEVDEEGRWPETGAHVYVRQAQLEKMSDDAYRVTGTKSFVTNGGYADSHVVSTVAADSGRPIGEFSCVLVNEAMTLTGGRSYVPRAQ